MQVGGLVQIVACFIKPGAAHPHEEIAGVMAQGQHDAQVFPIDSAQGCISSLLTAHYQQGMIGPHLIATHQQQLARYIGAGIIDLTHRAKQGGAVQHPLLDQVDRANKRHQCDLLTQLKIYLVTRGAHQRQHLTIGPLGVIQHIFHQRHRLVGGGGGTGFQLLHVVFVRYPSPHQQRQDEDHESAAEPKPAAGEIDIKKMHNRFIQRNGPPA